MFVGTENRLKKQDEIEETILTYEKKLQPQERTPLLNPYLTQSIL